MYNWADKLFLFQQQQQKKLFHHEIIKQLKFTKSVLPKVRSELKKFGKHCSKSLTSNERKSKMLFFTIELKEINKPTFN